jgi:hypothetical protein
MLRAVLTYPLIFALAAGPLLCCCTAGRALGSHAFASTPSSAPVSNPATVGHSCCGHKKQKSPAHPRPAKPVQCPCKDGANKIQATQSTTSAADLLEKVRTASPDYPVLAVMLAHDILPAEGANRACHGPSSLFPSAADLLFSHHRLRC